MKSRRITISLPEKIIRQLDTLRGRSDSESRSSLIKSSLSVFLGARIFPTYHPTKAELRSIDRGIREYKKGNFVTLDELRDELGLTHYTSDKEKNKKVTATR